MVIRMKKIIIFLGFLLFFISNSKIIIKAQTYVSLADDFMITIDQAYDEYLYVANEENLIGKIIIIIGSINEELNCSIYFQETTNYCHPIKATINEQNKNNEYVFKSNKQIKTYFGLPIKYNCQYQIAFVEEYNFGIFCEYTLSKYNDYQAFYQDDKLIKGEGQHNFENCAKWVNNTYIKAKINIIHGLTFFLGIFTICLISIIVLVIVFIHQQRKYHNRKYIIDLDEFLNLPRKKLIGKTICFGTDTVYGIGALMDDKKGINKIYYLKHREARKPLAVLCGCTADVFKYAKPANPIMIKMIKTYWPGALTIIFDDKRKEEGTIAFRIPNNKYALMILNKFGPMPTTSVNISGQPPLNTIEDIDKEFGYKIDYIVRFPEEHISSNIASTVVKVTKDNYKILRQGEIIIDNEILNEEVTIEKNV